MRRSLIGRAALFALLLTVAGGADGADESPRISFNAGASGALGRNDLGVGMLEARATLSPHLIVTAAPAIVSASAAKTEYQLRTAATLLMPLGPVQLDNRNLWVFSDAGTTRYRNRLRITAPLTVTGRSLREALRNPPRSVSDD